MEVEHVEKKTTPSKWWQWAFVYPTLVISLFGAIPTALQHYKAWRLQVDYNEVARVEEQHKLWERNADCLTSKGIYEVDAWDGSIVGVTLCKTGDALLRYQYKEENTSYVWVKSPRPYRGGKKQPINFWAR